jgi:hypothetical protein
MLSLLLMDGEAQFAARSAACCITTACRSTPDRVSDGILAQEKNGHES